MKYAFVLLIISILTSTLSTQAHTSLASFDNSKVFGYNDTLIAPDLPNTYLTTTMGSVPPVAGYYETSEFLIGSIAVGVIFLESNGTIDSSTEDWTPILESWVINEIYDGLSWFGNYNPDANVTILYDVHYQVPTSYEPINHSQSDEGLWIGEAMTSLGYLGISYFTQVRDYINDLRFILGTDWAFTIFVVNSYYDSDGEFTDNYSAYAYLGGPFLVMTYDNNGYGIGSMDWVAAHETGHIFYATDEYDNEVEYSGYLNAPDTQFTTTCLMGQPILPPPFLPWSICTNTQRQLGWLDLDGDGIQDIVDTFPNTVLTPYSPDPTNDTVLTYTGNATVTPYPNNNPYGTGRDITINTINEVEFRVNSEIWQNALPDDSVFDEAEEDFFFTTSILFGGTHELEARAINSVGNIEISVASDEVTVLARARTLQDFPVPFVDSEGVISASFIMGANVPHGPCGGAYMIDLTAAVPLSSSLGLNASSGRVEAYVDDEVTDFNETHVYAVDVEGNLITYGSAGVNLVTRYFNDLGDELPAFMKTDGTGTYIYVPSTNNSYYMENDYWSATNVTDYGMIVLHYDAVADRHVIISAGFSGYSTRATATYLAEYKAHPLDGTAIIIRYYDEQGDGVHEEVTVVAVVPLVI